VVISIVFVRFVAVVNMGNIVAATVAVVMLVTAVMGIVAVTGIVAVSLSIFLGVLISVVSAAVAVLVVMLVVGTPEAEDVMFDSSVKDSSVLKIDFVILLVGLTVTALAVDDAEVGVDN